jgi:hypothetical protein
VSSASKEMAGAHVTRATGKAPALLLAPAGTLITATGSPMGQMPSASKQLQPHHANVIGATGKAPAPLLVLARTSPLAAG